MMIIRTVVATVLAIAPVFVIAQSCQLPGSHRMAANTTWSGGQMYTTGLSQIQPSERPFMQRGMPGMQPLLLTVLAIGMGSSAQAIVR